MAGCRYRGLRPVPMASGDRPGGCDVRTGKSMTHRIDKGSPSLYAADIEGLLQDFRAILAGGRLTQGQFLDRFERAFSEYVGVAHAVGMSSGTAPLEVALRYFGVEGGEVIVPTNTFAATANAVILAGGTPVFADLDPSTLCSGLGEVDGLLTGRTRAVIAVHLAGLIVPGIDDISAWCRANSLFLLEDAAHAHGSRIGDRAAGALADAASFSFYPSKVMTSGEGGMLTTNDPELAAFARSFRSHGQAADSRSIVRLGSNYRLPELSAALGLSQLRKLDEIIARRARLADRYRQRLGSRKDIRLIATPENQVHSHYKLPVVLPPGMRRDRMTAALSAQGIATGSIYWPPCHLEPYFAGQSGEIRAHCPVAEEILSRTLTLPLHTGMSLEEVDLVCESLVRALD